MEQDHSLSPSFLLEGCVCVCRCGSCFAGICCTMLTTSPLGEAL
jgi:hypothetical protein